MRKRILVTMASVLFAIGCTQITEKRANIVQVPTPEKGATYVGTEMCLGCHEEYGKDKYNVHNRIKQFEVAGGYQVGCESCHGPGSVHVDTGGDPTKILRFPKKGSKNQNENGIMTAQEISTVCSTCHHTGDHLNWASSAHAQTDVSCTSCHDIHHNPNKQLLTMNERELCASCHQDINAQMYFPSHHPIKEGKMKCSSCHNPHGSNNFSKGLLKTTERVNDLCLSCHTRYQGPYVFEHNPVVENCLICHDPHGTVANNLLRQQEPFLCLQCHEAHFHGARASNSKIEVTAPGDHPNTLKPVHKGFQKAFLTKCTQCHTYIHGSDLPSQALTGAGKAFTR